MRMITMAGSLVALAAAASPVLAQERTLMAYGPGGPAPAMKSAAEAFQAQTGIAVQVTAGPTPQWKDQAAQDADVVFSGSENMMADFAKAMPDLFDLSAATPIYLRPSAILVRPGNPDNIRGFADLLQPGVSVMTVGGAGQIGMWEDVAGRAGKVSDVAALRANLIFPEPPNSAAAKELWTQDDSIDAWLIWNIWQIDNPDIADLVEIEPEYRIWRPVDVVVTANADAEAQQFVEFLTSDAGRQIFEASGWTAGP